MTEIKSAIKQIQTEMIKDIDIPKSAKTELANQKALRLAIRSLKAWEEVLNELEEVKVAYYQDSAFITSNAIQLVIDFIKQKLSEIEE